MQCRNQGIHEHMLTHTRAELRANAYTRNAPHSVLQPQAGGDSPAHTRTSLPRTAWLSPLHCHPLNPPHSKLLLGEDLAGLDEREELGEGWLATGLPSGSLWKKGPSYVREELELPLLGHESTPGKRKTARVSEGPTCSWPCERCWHGSWLVMAHVRCGVVGWCVLMHRVWELCMCGAVCRYM